MPNSEIESSITVGARELTPYHSAAIRGAVNTVIAMLENTGQTKKMERYYLNLLEVNQMIDTSIIKNYLSFQENNSQNT